MRKAKHPIVRRLRKSKPKERLSCFRELEKYRSKIQEQLVLASKLSDIDVQIEDVERKIDKLVLSGVLPASSKKNLRGHVMKAKRRINKAKRKTLNPAPV